MTKKRILVFAPMYLPGFKAGGPIRSIANLVETLSDEFDFYIVTSDRDLGDNDAYPNIEHHEWITVGKAKVWYLCPKQQKLSYIKKLMKTTGHDVIYLNGLWEPAFTILPIIINKFSTDRKPLVQAVRGMLGDNTIKIKYLKKKMCLWLLYHLFGFNKSTIYQCSSEREAKGVRKHLGQSANTTVVSNVPGLNTVSEPVLSKKHKMLRMVFLSRISPIKNLDGALRCLTLVKEQVDYFIYGIKEDEQYWHKCQKIIESMPENIKVIYKGPIEPTDVIDKLSRYDCFFLPTHHENFGHVVHDSLRAGLPVLLSNNTPWHDVRYNSCGWEFPDNDYEGFAKKINELAGVEPDVFHKLKLNALDYANRFAKENDIVKNNRKLFEKALMCRDKCL